MAAATLLDLIAQLEAVHRPTRALRASLTVASMSLNFSTCDSTYGASQLANVVSLVDSEVGPTSYGLSGYSSWSEWGAALPARQQADAQTVIAAAISEANRLLSLPTAATARPNSFRSGPAGAPSREPSTNLTGAFVGRDGFMRRADGGGAVFGLGYNKILNAFKVSSAATDASLNPAWDSFNRLGLNLFTCHVYPQSLLLPNRTIDIENSVLKKCLSLLDDLPSRGARLLILVANKLPNWAYSAYPGLDASAWSNSGRAGSFASSYEQHSVEYDIDHPEAMPLMSATLRQVASHIGCHPGLDSWIIANEPTFRATPSPHTASAFRGWLRDRYVACIDCLNRAWLGSGSSWYASFDDVLSSPPQPAWWAEGVPNWDPELDSGEMRRWLDWSAFNDLRVTSWLTGLRDAIKGVSACHRVHAKFNTGPALPLRALDTGIDRVAAARLLDINGLDSGFPQPWHDGGGEQRGTRRGPFPIAYDNRRYTGELE